MYMYPHPYTQAGPHNANTHIHTRMLIAGTYMKTGKKEVRSLAIQAQVTWGLEASCGSGSGPLATLTLREPSYYGVVLTTKLRHYGEACASNMDKAAQRRSCTTSGASDVRGKEPLNCPCLSQTENASESWCESFC